ncbi:hypothetical protein NP493_892g01005 [Ridgeia piscesae]|uniref:RING-type domain-containing protein n=1 Tax=Ridgeia piscesae TaxID=27915 RepID=A0AAD9NK19_RIDPI|nr:hypothetical protein NP493_892g01005 [Ridgeia piscesae]
MAENFGNHPERSVRVSVSSDTAATTASNRMLPDDIRHLLEHVLSPELQHQVLNDLQQHFSQQSTSRLAQHAASATHQPAHQHTHMHPVDLHTHRMPMTGLHGGPGGESESLVINMSEDETDSEGTGNASLVETPAPASGQQGAGISRADQMQAANLLHTFYNAMESLLPFICLLMIKFMFDHRLGLLVFIGLLGTFYHANTNLKKNITQRDNRSWTDSVGCMAWIITFLSANIFLIYYMFEDQHLYRSLYLCLPKVGEVSLWQLVWIVGITDFVIRYGAIILKAVVAMLPRFVLRYKRKGKYYMLIEVTSQFYRAIVPSVPWLYYFYDNREGGVMWFSVILMVLYVVCKSFNLWIKVRELWTALKKFKSNVRYGTVPNREELNLVENNCPICQDKLSDPVRLSCKHIFCEDCITLWFDREQTCPMCRASIADRPVWQDGSTAGVPQLF